MDGRLPLGSVVGDYEWSKGGGKNEMVFGFDKFEVRLYY